MVVNDAAVGADGHINAGLLEVFVTGCGDLDQRGGLATADALGLAGDADGATADTHLDKVCAGLGQETETVTVHHVTGTDLDGVAVVFPDPGDGLGLPAGVALGGVDAQHIGTGFQQSGNALGVVTGVDAGTYQVTLFGVQQFQGVGLVGGVVLAEYEIHQMAFIVHDGQAVELMLPNDVVGHLQRGLLGGDDQLFQGGHEGGHLVQGAHAGHAVVTAGDNAQQLTGGSAVVGDGHGGETVGGLQIQHIGQSMIRSQIGGGDHEASLVALDLADHFCLALNGLRTENEAQTTLFCQGDGQGIVGNGLHDSGGHGDVQRDGAFFLVFAILDQRGTQTNTVGDTVFAGVAGDQQVFAESMAGLGVNISHGNLLLYKISLELRS